MLVQLGIGSGLTLVTIIVAALAWWGLEALLKRMHGWSTRSPHGPKLMSVLALSLIWTLGMMAIAIWLWAIAFHWLQIFGTYEEAVYFSLVAFTTLGFGDILLPQEWRLLSGLAAANGLLMFGLLTAILVETLRETRTRQRNTSTKS